MEQSQLQKQSKKDQDLDINRFFDTNFKIEVDNISVFKDLTTQKPVQSMEKLVDDFLQLPTEVETSFQH